jgi:hypothetical protein
MKRFNAGWLFFCIIVLLVACATIPDVPLSAVYDDFNNTNFEGKINSNLWDESQNDTPAVMQANGELVFSTNGPAPAEGEKRLYSTIRVPLEAIQYVGATLSLRDVGSGIIGHIAINLQCQITDTKEFWIEADLINQNNHPVLFCKIGYFGDVSYEEHGFTYGDGLEFDKEYKILITMDSSSGNIAWSIDGTIINETISTEYLKNKKKKAALVINSYRAEGADLNSHADDALFFWRM